MKKNIKKSLVVLLMLLIVLTTLPLSASANSYMFPSMPVGYTTSPIAYPYVSNPSYSVTLRNVTLSLSGPHASAFALERTFLGDIPPRTDVSVAFWPILGLTPGTYSVTITATATNGTASEPLSASFTVLNVFTVTFLDWDGSILKSESVVQGSGATAPAPPSRDGYKFIGWDRAFSNVASNLTVTALYEVIPPLTGIPMISNTAPRIGDVLTASLENTNNTGTLNYTWKADGIQTGTGRTYTVPPDDLGKTLTLDITSTMETGMLTSSATDPVRKKAPPDTPAAPTLDAKTHYSVTLIPNEAHEFSLDGTAWQQSSAFIGLSPLTAYTFYQRIAETPDTEASAASPALNVTTDPLPIHIVTFDPNNGVSAPWTTEIEHGEKASVPDKPVNPGHLFVAWYLDDEEFDFDTIIRSSITLKAKWVEIPLTSLRIAYANGQQTAIVVPVSQNSTYQFTAITNDGALAYLTWSVNNPNLATVDANGLVTTKDMEGHAALTVRAPNGVTHSIVLRIT